MSSVDHVSDFLARVRNAYMAGLKFVEVPQTKLLVGCLQAMQREGYLDKYDVYEAGVHKKIRVSLKYVEGKRAIVFLKRVSKPSCRVYSSVEELRPVANGFGTVFLSTSKGVISDHEARQMRVGGEVLFRLF